MDQTPPPDANALNLLGSMFGAGSRTKLSTQGGIYSNSSTPNMFHPQNRGQAFPGNVSSPYPLPITKMEPVVVGSCSSLSDSAPNYLNYNSNSNNMNSHIHDTGMHDDSDTEVFETGSTKRKSGLKYLSSKVRSILEEKKELNLTQQSQILQCQTQSSEKEVASMKRRQYDVLNVITCSGAIRRVDAKTYQWVGQPETLKQLGTTVRGPGIEGERSQIELLKEKLASLNAKIAEEKFQQQKEQFTYACMAQHQAYKVSGKPLRGYFPEEEVNARLLGQSLDESTARTEQGEVYEDAVSLVKHHFAAVQATPSTPVYNNLPASQHRFIQPQPVSVVGLHKDVKSEIDVSTTTAVIKSEKDIVLQNELAIYRILHGDRLKFHIMQLAPSFQAQWFKYYPVDGYECVKSMTVLSTNNVTAHNTKDMFKGSRNGNQQINANPHSTYSGSHRPLAIHPNAATGKERDTPYLSTYNANKLAYSSSNGNSAIRRELSMSDLPPTKSPRKEFSRNAHTTTNNNTNTSNNNDMLVSMHPTSNNNNTTSIPTIGGQFSFLANNSVNNNNMNDQQEESQTQEYLDMNNNNNNNNNSEPSTNQNTPKKVGRPKGKTKQAITPQRNETQTRSGRVSKVKKDDEIINDMIT